MSIKATPRPKRQNFAVVGFGVCNTPFFLLFADNMQVPKGSFEKDDPNQKFPYFVSIFDAFETLEAAKAFQKRQSELDGRLQLDVVPVGVPIPIPPVAAMETTYLNKDEDEFMREFEKQQGAQKEFLEQKAAESRRRQEVLKSIGPERVDQLEWMDALFMHH